MVRTFIHGLMIAAFLGQGWAPAAMAAPAEPTSQSDCAGHIQPGAEGDCCPDGAMTAGACASLCSAAFGLAAAAPEVIVNRDQSVSNLLQPARAGPNYLPLNPPPIA